jgi:hypothetical protein
MPNNFITGVWYQPLSSFATWAARGVNTLFGYADEDQPENTHYPTWKAAAAAHGLKYVVQWIDPFHTHAQQPLTGADNSDPNLLAVMLPDEPDGAGNRTPGQIIDLAIAIKAVLPSKPIFLNVDGFRTQYRPFNDYRCYFQGADWCSLDYYPLNAFGDINNTTILGQRVDTIINAGAAAGGQKKYFCALECSDQNARVLDWVQAYPDLKARMRGPTAAEMAQEVDEVIRRPLSGIIWFPDRIGGTFAFDATNAEQQAAMTSINTMLLAR